jgi:hypothetical protein
MTSTIVLNIALPDLMDPISLSHVPIIMICLSAAK